MLLASLQRQTTSVLAVPLAVRFLNLDMASPFSSLPTDKQLMQGDILQEEFHISLPQLGLLQSAALMGYLVGQVNSAMTIHFKACEYSKRLVSASRQSARFLLQADHLTYEDGIIEGIQPAAL